jgi:hypothetical protein
VIRFVMSGGLGRELARRFRLLSSVLRLGVWFFMMCDDL